MMKVKKHGLSAGLRWTLFTLLAGIVACSKSDPEPSPYILIPEYLATHADLYPNVEMTESGLYYVIQEPGTGNHPVSGDVVAVHYRGYHTNDVEFDTSYDSGYPLSFTIDESNVIQGWHEGIPLLKTGGRAVLFIPSGLAYGENRVGNIAPNEDLIFEVKLVEIIGQ